MNKIQVTAQQRANAIEARDVMWPSVPPKNVYPKLKDWRKGRAHTKSRAPDCGTVACFGGWCAWWPTFRDQGIVADEIGAPDTPHQWGANVSHTLFGTYEMFKGRGHPACDIGFRGSDHALVAHRLNWLIENSEVKK